MTSWQIPVNPMGSLQLSALVAALPVFYLFWAVGVRRLPGHTAGLGVLLVALLVAVFGYHMPLTLALLSGFYGMAFGLFPICWIVLNALFVYNLAQEAGHMETIRRSIASLTTDRAIQALLIAFSFGAFLEGAAGFGAPVAITAAMLVALGFAPQNAAILCLLANTAPVAFGALGVPILVTSQVAGLPPEAVGRVVGNTLPVLSIVVPFYLVFLLSGLGGVRRAWPWLALGGFSFAITQWASARFLGPHLPDILAGLASLFVVGTLLWLCGPKENPVDSKSPSLKQALLSFLPFLLLSLLVALWGIPPFKAGLDKILDIKLSIPWLDGAVVRNGKPLTTVFELNLLSTAGTALFLVGAISCSIFGFSLKRGAQAYLKTLKALSLPILTIASFLGFAYVANFSGISLTLGVALAQTGRAFVQLSPFLGWLGVFLTGSDTSSGALFGMLQRSAAEQIGVDPLILVAANATGGVAGKMISPSSLAIACASVGLVGKEGEVFLKTLGHSLLFASLIAVIVTLQAYGFWFS
jgi:lactate permease